MCEWPSCVAQGPIRRTSGHASPRYTTSFTPGRSGLSLPYHFDSSQEYGVQLHDPRLLEYVGAPESARLLSHDPEYWVEHMGREKTLSAALQLQHDAGLILSYIHILQQLVTALHGASANVMGAVRGHQPFPTQAMRAAHYMTAMGLWRPPIAPGIQGSLPVAACKSCMSSGVCYPEMPQQAGRQS